MKMTDPKTGCSYVGKRRRRYHEPGQPRELTFSCYRRFAFLAAERTCEWFCLALEKARSAYAMQLWAYVLMPEHVHLLVYQAGDQDRMSQFLQAVKEPVARKAIAFLKESAPAWLPRLTVREGTRVRQRFWQPGGGYDRNVTSAAALRLMIEYIHANPVRRGLVAKPEDWEWSSARWYAGLRPFKMAMDKMVLDELQWDGTRST